MIVIWGLALDARGAAVFGLTGGQRDGAEVVDDLGELFD